MQTLNGKIASLVAAGVIVGGLPLLGFMYLFIDLMVARNAGHPQNGDAIGLGVMSTLAYGIALLSFAIGVGYFGLKLTKHKLTPKRWHWIALVWSSLEIATPIFYFSFL